MSSSPPDAAQDEFYMQRALALATDTVALASPNPQVGCVLVQNAQIIGEGAHLYDLRHHAEIAALKQAAHLGHSPVGATAYVTLEPCSHHGRTPPCADALITAGIDRCVIATADPNPLVSGQGIGRLRGTGIEVTLGTLQQRARALNDAFAHFIQQRRPFVTLKAALSADGKLAPPPSSRKPNQPFWITGPAARQEVQLLRHASDAILTGIGTVLTDNPALTDRTGLPRRRPLLRVVLDTHLRLPVHSQLVRTASRDLLVLCSENAPTANRAALEALDVEVATLPAMDGLLDLKALLATLADRQILSLLLETGATLNGAFLSQDLTDKLILFYAESELGESALPFAKGISSPFLLEHNLTRLTRTSFVPDAGVTGYLHDPWPSAPLHPG